MLLDGFQLERSDFYLANHHIAIKEVDKIKFVNLFTLAVKSKTSVDDIKIELYPLVDIFLFHDKLSAASLISAIQFSCLPRDNKTKDRV